MDIDVLGLGLLAFFASLRYPSPQRIAQPIPAARGDPHEEGIAPMRPVATGAARLELAGGAWARCPERRARRGRAHAARATGPFEN